MKQWYVIQVYTGFEDVVKTDLDVRFKEEGIGDLLDEILIPTGEVASFFSENENKKEKIFPGYILVKMEMTGDSQRLVSNTPHVSRFLGGDSPSPISVKEIERIFSQIEGKLSIAKERTPFAIGNEIHICSGAFSGFVGIIDKIDEEKERISVMVSIFGRLTPVELGFDQVKK
jgi:transcription termination/antitermination protein NusG